VLKNNPSLGSPRKAGVRGVRRLGMTSAAQGGTGVCGSEGLAGVPSAGSWVGGGYAWGVLEPWGARGEPWGPRGEPGAGGAASSDASRGWMWREILREILAVLCEGPGAALRGGCT